MQSDSTCESPFLPYHSLEIYDLLSDGSRVLENDSTDQSSRLTTKLHVILQASLTSTDFTPSTHPTGGYITCTTPSLTFSVRNELI
jgi:hypothetical protein